MKIDEKLVFGRESIPKTKFDVIIECLNIDLLTPLIGFETSYNLTLIWSNSQFQKFTCQFYYN